MRTRYLVPIIAFLSAMVPAAADAQTFSFGVHPKFVNITFESRMEIEDIFGSTHAISGWVKLDRRGATFRLEVPVASLRTGIDTRDEHLRSETWLDAARYPKIVFEGRSIRDLGKGRYQVSGLLDLHGQKRAQTVVVSARRIPRKLAERLGLGDAEWVRVRGTFQVKLSDHGVRIPEMTAAKVNDLWTVKVSLFAKQEVR
jgi:polyisoprenoid-binding protein YceI